MKIKIKKSSPLAKTPFRKHETDACFDIVATSIEDLGDGRIRYGTALHIETPQNMQLDIRSRSSIHKKGLILSNGIGTGDEGYMGEYQAVFYNMIDTLPNYKVGERIAQIQFKKRYDVAEWVEVEELEETKRGEGGFGSTGK
jgi:dUTP pyrophosphatase